MVNWELRGGLGWAAAKNASPALSGSGLEIDHIKLGQVGFSSSTGSARGMFAVGSGGIDAHAEDW